MLSLSCPSQLVRNFNIAIFHLVFHTFARQWPATLHMTQTSMAPTKRDYPLKMFTIFTVILNRQWWNNAYGWCIYIFPWNLTCHERLNRNVLIVSQKYELGRYFTFIFDLSTPTPDRVYRLSQLMHFWKRPVDPWLSIIDLFSAYPCIRYKWTTFQKALKTHS